VESVDGSMMEGEFGWLEEEEARWRGEIKKDV
jgi:hypothetical protein